jgi:dCTP deaminase
MILVDDEIEQAVNSGEIEISDFSAKYLQPASYDLRVGEEGFTLSAGRVVKIQDEGLLDVQPGDFALVMTHEKVRLPTNMVGRFGLRSAHARIGLLATAGPQIDPGFEGKLVIGLVSFSSQVIKLPYLAPFCTLELYRLPRHASSGYRGPYQGQDHLTEKIIRSIPKEPFPLAVMLIRQLVAASPSLRRPEAEPSHWRRLPKNLASFEREEQAFERLKPQLLKTHRGQYVAIRDERAVLFGANKTELAKRVYEEFGYRPLYIGLLEQGAEVVHVPTPRTAKRVP